MKRIEVCVLDSLKNPVETEEIKKKINEIGINISEIYSINVYNIDEELTNEELEKLSNELFADRVVEKYSIDKPIREELHRIEIGFLPGVTDNVGKTAREGIRDVLGKECEVHFSKVYALEGNLNHQELEKIAGMVLANKLIESWRIFKSGDTSFIPYIPKVKIKSEPTVEKIELPEQPEKLRELSKQRLLALNVEEMEKIREYLKKPAVRRRRKRAGLGKEITDVELEALAQSWSEHCKHKIFNAVIEYEENGEKKKVNSIFKSYIKKATEDIKKSYVVSVFHDNGGIIKMDHEHNIAVKVETHNAPSALDPYGGALTGILGVNRDVLGTGLGAKPVANVNMLCFGILDTDVPPKVLPTRRIMKGVIKGIQDGGNKVGIPTVNGSITFDECYNTRPLVYAGTIGLLPAEINGKRTSVKTINDGDYAIMVGGKIGKDGIHGATFSSQQITGNISSSVVQIGDPITQKKVIDFVLEARDSGLYNAITDNGAGGLSSSIGEMAQMSGGCEIYLERCPLKYPGLDPWEILVSESQERMSLAVPPESMEKLKEIAKKHDVELTIVGLFTNSGMFHILYNNKTAAYLDMEFLHEGVPQMKLTAEWKPPEKEQDELWADEIGFGEGLKKLLSSPNIASKEWVVRRYDHEVQGGSVIKPLMGLAGPSDAGVFRPILEKEWGVVVGHGICPKYIEDGGKMAMLAFDEAVRNVIASGGDFEHMAALDNFSWPNPIKGKGNEDGGIKLANLVKAAEGIYKIATSYQIPLISGKDSMKNDYFDGKKKYSIKPTLLITVVGKIENIKKAVSIEIKESGDILYVIGNTRPEMGGAEYLVLQGIIRKNIPYVEIEKNIRNYKKLVDAMKLGLVRSAHDVSDGGLAVALAESSFSGGYGVDVNLELLKNDGCSETAMIFSETPGRFVVSVKERDVQSFEKIMNGADLSRIGRVRGDKRFILRLEEKILINEDAKELRNLWRGGIEWRG
ncbi:phosphoribosylformylglycinamidine synthase subunit PurL [Candidatus Micrarchaeota archaeon]|nr:phosphoribosylformylglycinamidine synthase subunit PurL [Candidatus Micrarchaeota archaeon]